VACNVTAASSPSTNTIKTCTQCRPGYNLDSNSQNCIAGLPSKCLLPTTNTTCAQCTTGFYVNGSSVCNACKLPCLLCSNVNGTDCHACQQGQVLNVTSIKVNAITQNVLAALDYNAFTGVCAPNCSAVQASINDSVFEEQYYRRCFRCLPGCQQCNHPLLCQQCKIGFFPNQTVTSNNQALMNNTSLPANGSVYNLTMLQTLTPCQPCHPSCRSCNGPNNTQCSRCNPGYILNGSTCQSNPCSAGYFPNSIDITQEVNNGTQPTISQVANTSNTVGTPNVTVTPVTPTTTTTSTGTTTPITTMQCSVCDSSCATCVGSSNQNCTSCPSGLFLQNGTCISCSSGCNQCQNNAVCASCATGYNAISQTLSTRTCVQSCPAGFIKFDPSVLASASNLTSALSNLTGSASSNLTSVLSNLTSSLPSNVSTNLNTSTLNSSAIIASLGLLPAQVSGVNSTSCLPCLVNCTYCASYLTLFNQSCINTTCPIGYTLANTTSSVGTFQVCNQMKTLDSAIVWAAPTPDGSIDGFHALNLTVNHNVPSTATVTFNWRIDFTQMPNTTDTTDLFANVKLTVQTLFIPGDGRLYKAQLQGQKLALAVDVTSSIGNKTLFFSASVTATTPNVNLSCTQSGQGGLNNLFFANFTGVNGSTASQTLYIWNEATYGYYKQLSMLTNFTLSDFLANKTMPNINALSSSGKPTNFFELQFSCANTSCINNNFTLPTAKVNQTYYCAGIFSSTQIRIVEFQSITVLATLPAPNTSTSSGGNSTGSPTAPKVNISNATQVAQTLGLNTVNFSQFNTSTTNSTTKSSQLNTLATAFTDMQSTLTTPIADTTGTTDSTTNNNNNGTSNTSITTTPSNVPAVDVNGDSCTPVANCSNQGCWRREVAKCVCLPGFFGDKCDMTAQEVQAKLNFTQQVTTVLSNTPVSNEDDRQQVISTTLTIVSTPNVPLSTQSQQDILNTVKNCQQVKTGDPDNLQVLIQLNQRSMESSSQNYNLANQLNTTNGTTDNNTQGIQQSIDQNKAQQRQFAISLQQTTVTELTAIATNTAANLTDGQSQPIQMDGLSAQIVKNPFKAASQQANNSNGTNSSSSGVTTGSNSVTVSLDDRNVDNSSTGNNPNRPSVTLALPLSLTNQISSNSNMVFSSTPNLFAQNLNYQVTESTNVYTVVFTSATGDEINLSNLTNPAILCIPRSNSTSGNSSLTATITCKYMNPNDASDLEDVETDLSQLSQGLICCKLTHFSDFSAIGTADTSTNANNGMKLVGQLSGLLLAFLSLILFI
jgi:hypothetical protein